MADWVTEEKNVQMYNVYIKNYSAIAVDNLYTYSSTLTGTGAVGTPLKINNL